MKHHYRVWIKSRSMKIPSRIFCLLFKKSLKGWTFAFESYYAENITRLLDNPYFQTMANVIDPYGLIKL